MVRPSVTDGWPERTVVVVGDAPVDWGRQAVRLAEARGWPVLSEPSGNARTGPHALTLGHLLLDPGTHPELRPERVLVVGRPTLDRRVAALLADPAVEVVVAAPTARWADTSRSATRVVGSLPDAGDHRPVDRGLARGLARGRRHCRRRGRQPLGTWTGGGIAAALACGPAARCPPRRRFLDAGARPAARRTP